MPSNRILFLAANPGSTAHLALDEEARDIESKLRASKYHRELNLKTRWAVRFDDVLQAFNEDHPVIVHFSGHGADARGIVLHDEAGESNSVSADALQKLFKALKDDIRLVVLNACYTAEQARAIADVIDCVVGMNQAIGDEPARSFAASFYRALGFGRSVKNAFDQGLVSIAGHANRSVTGGRVRDVSGHDVRADHGPELFARSGVDPHHVFIVDDALVQSTVLAGSAIDHLITTKGAVASLHDLALEILKLRVGKEETIEHVRWRWKTFGRLGSDDARRVLRGLKPLLERTLEVVERNRDALIKRDLELYRSLIQAEMRKKWLLDEIENTSTCETLELVLGEYDKLVERLGVIEARLLDEQDKPQ